MRSRFVMLVVAFSGCIVPDRDIQIDPGLDNEGAVRIIQRAPQMAEMDDLCNAMPTEDADFAFCPEVRYTQPSGLIRPDDGGAFCICPGPVDQVVKDIRAIASFEIYAEDGDVQGDRSEDTLYGVALMDPDPLSSAPSSFWAYENFWFPCREGERIPVSDGRDGDRTGPPVGRESNQVTVFKLDNGSSPAVMDLCNNDNGHPLTPGLHNLQFMVTDRPFFQPPELLVDEPVVGDDGKPRFAQPQCGVPDLAAGATYTVIDYVFECVDAAVDPPDCVQPGQQGDGNAPVCVCNCKAPEGS